jgi:hypothetical protein
MIVERRGAPRLAPGPESVCRVADAGGTSHLAHIHNISPVGAALLLDQTISGPVVGLELTNTYNGHCVQCQLRVIRTLTVEGRILLCGEFLERVPLDAFGSLLV